MALPNAHSWKAIREELKRCFSHQTSLGHAAAQLENMTQKPNASWAGWITSEDCLLSPVTLVLCLSG